MANQLMHIPNTDTQIFPLLDIQHIEPTNQNQIKFQSCETNE